MPKQLTPPTAEEFGEYMLPRGIFWYKEFEEMMIGFAKLHVEAALKAASEKAFHSPILGMPFEQEVDKDSILTAYPLTNIK